MEYGARNKITAKVKSIKKGEVMALVKYRSSSHLKWRRF